MDDNVLRRVGPERGFLSPESVFELYMSFKPDSVQGSVLVPGGTYHFYIYMYICMYILIYWMLFANPAEAVGGLDAGGWALELGASLASLEDPGVVPGRSWDAPGVLG